MSTARRAAPTRSRPPTTGTECDGSPGAMSPVWPQTTPRPRWSSCRDHPHPVVVRMSRGRSARRRPEASTRSWNPRTVHGLQGCSKKVLNNDRNVRYAQASGPPVSVAGAELGHDKEPRRGLDRRRGARGRPGPGPSTTVEARNPAGRGHLGGDALGRLHREAATVVGPRRDRSRSPDPAPLVAEFWSPSSPPRSVCPPRPGRPTSARPSAPLPAARLWARVVKGDLPAWRARRIAPATILTSVEAAGYVDLHVAHRAQDRPAQVDRR